MDDAKFPRPPMIPAGQYMVQILLHTKKHNDEEEFIGYYRMFADVRAKSKVFSNGK